MDDQKRLPGGLIFNTNKPRATRKDRKVQSATYPCIYCGRRMYTDEVIDVGPVPGNDGVRQIKKHHRECKEKARAAASKDLLAEKRPDDDRPTSGTNPGT